MISILFLHGSAGSKNNFKYLERELSQFKTISFDLPGYGEEQKPKVDYTVEFFLDHIKKKIDPKQKYIIVGHSLGAILAKEFALRYPQNVAKIICINYPMKKDLVRKHWLSGMFLRKTIGAKLMCHTKIIWKYFFYPIYLFHNYKYLDSFRDYFKHTFHSETSTVQHVFMKDTLLSLEKIKRKIIFISGTKDPFVDKTIIEKSNCYWIKNMGHLFFHHEQEIASIIRKHVGRKI